MSARASSARRGATSALLAGLCACAPTTSVSPQAPQAPATVLRVDSTGGCRLDDDCRAGLFCFQQACVAECATDAECPGASRCSPRSRCVVAAAPDTSRAVDEARFAASATDTAAVRFDGWPQDSTVRVLPGQAFARFTLEASADLAEGRLLYTVQPHGGARQVLRAEGTRRFTLEVPVGAAGGDTPRTQVVQVVTPAEGRTLYLVPARPSAGWYAGTYTPPVFGGAGLPLEFGVQTQPPDVARLQDATQAWLWLPASSSFLVSLATPASAQGWVRRPLTWDASVNAWVAVFAEDLAPAEYFGPGVFPGAARALRFEVAEEDSGTLRGAVADRWRGLYDVRTPGGVSAPGVATVAGQFTVSRLAALPPVSQVRDGSGTPSPSAQQPSPDLGGCQDTFLAVPPLPGETDGPCKDVGSLATFQTASPLARATCALGVAQAALSGQTVGAMLQALLDPAVPDPQGLTFRGFIEACASEQSALCKPSPRLSCARALLATAYVDAALPDAEVQAVAAAYDAATREAFLGRQLAAFQVDTQTRLDWLRTSEAPAFLASTLREYNVQILDRWRGKVLDAHLSGVFGQLDGAGLAVLTRAPSDPAAIAARQALLLDLANSWRAAMDALVLLTTRWNVLFQDARSRTQAAALVRTTSARLYVSAAILQELARESGASYLSTTFGAGFSVLQRELNRLALPFDQLLFARDAEVVTSKSLDPEQNAASLLSERETAARVAVADAAASVNRVLDDAQQATVDEVSLAARYEDQLLTLRNELISLCGLPVGCTPAEAGTDPACAPPTQAGRCGFAVPRGGGASTTESVSEAGGAVLRLKEAALAGNEAGLRLQGLVQQVTLVGATTEAFADRVEDWDRRRRAVGQETDALLAEIDALESEQLQARVDALRDQAAVRKGAYARQQAEFSRWSILRRKGAETDLKKLQTLNALNITSSVLGLSADRVDLLAEIYRDGTEKLEGATTDPSATARLAIRYPAFLASSALATAAGLAEATASTLEVALQGEQALREAQLDDLSDLAELVQLASENELADLEAQVEQSALLTEAQQSTLQALLDSLQRNLALDQAHERDLQELKDRRDAWRLMTVDLLRLQYGVLQAELTARQRELAYYEVVQRAQLLEGRYRSMQARFSNLQSLLGSPDVLFSFQSRMARAESRIDRARRALEDWLVALEYYAVRPFVDQRLAILLARNPSQLEAIANEFLRLQRACGGPVTVETVDVSLRDDLLGMGFAAARTEGDAASPGERFRALLARAQTPVSRRVPYSPTQSLGERLAGGDVWAASFALSAEGFANLARTCNAKLESVAVQLVGEGFSGQPVVSLVYDGASQLRSCQGGIDTLVQALGPGATAFASVTDFKTAGRTVSPLASLDGFGPRATWNRSLEGLPLAAGYTVLVDLRHPSNADLDWSRLEDVRLQLRYSYQDVFPEGQCQ